MGPRGHLSRNAASDRASKHPNMVAGGAMYPAVGFQAPFKNLELVIINYWIWFRKYNHTARLLSNEHLNNKLWNTKDWNNIIFEWANHVDGWDQQSQQINKAPNRMILEVTVQWRLGTASNPTENQKYTAFPPTTSFYVENRHYNDDMTFDFSFFLRFGWGFQPWSSFITTLISWHQQYGSWVIKPSKMDMYDDVISEMSKNNEQLWWAHPWPILHALQKRKILF